MTKDSKPKTLAVKLHPKAERLIKKGHPWIFSGSIQKINKEGKAGDAAILFDGRHNKVFGVGLFDPDSPIRIKVVHHGGAAMLNEEFFAKKLSDAYDIRKPLLEHQTDAYRFIYGENDGFPGLIVDVYNKVGVLKLYSAIWFPYLPKIIPALVNLAELDALVLRLSRNLQKNDFKMTEGEVLYGTLEQSEIEFHEYGITFRTDVIAGHKTGFFLDHRQNRKRVGELSKEKTVLDVFSYSGGFSIHALAGGAKEVTSIDFSSHALELAKTNAALNPHSGNHQTITGDAFAVLRDLIQAGRKFDIVVIDPPSFAKSAKEIEIAKKKYAELANLGAQLTNKGGILLLASCSSRITTEEFYHIHQEEFEKQNLIYDVMDYTDHDIDHPITFNEGAYLKSAYYRII